MSDQKYGPNTAQVERLIERVGRMTPQEDALVYARSRADDAVWVRARDAARGARRIRPWNAAGAAALKVCRTPAWASVRDAARALVVRDLVSRSDFEALVAPVASVLGRCWEEKRDVRAV